jgi:hypothetical protein
MVGTESVAGESFRNWQQVWEHEWVIGDFIWTALDYLGESAIGFATETNLMDECDATEVCVIRSTAALSHSCCIALLQP